MLQAKLMRPMSRAAVLALVIVILICGTVYLEREALLTWAIGHDSSSLVNFLLRLESDSGRVGAEGRTSLMMAAEAGSSHAVESLLRHGSQIDAKDNKGLQAIHYAAKNGQADGTTVWALLTHGADPAAPTENGSTPLMLAVRSLDGGTQLNALELIAYSADVNQVDASGKTALMYATTDGGTLIINSLLRAGADPNLRTKGGVLPIVESTRNGQVEDVKVLLHFGADPFLAEGKESAYSLSHGPAPNSFLEKKFPEIAAEIDKRAASLGSRANIVRP